MKTRRKRAGHSGTVGKRRSASSLTKKRTTQSRDHARPNSKIRELPPNENIGKRADEVYGDTEIPERKPGT